MAVCFVLRMRVKEGSEEEFLRRYDALQRRIGEGLDGHIVHYLCQQADEPSRWLMASYWEDIESSQAWERSDDHRALTLPLRECFSEPERTAYEVRVETRHP
jgi:heme-degrading monooxygenase HmoA